MFISCQHLVYEDPFLQTVGHTAFTDEGKVAQKTFLIEKNTIVGLLDSILYPYNQGLCGYLGYGKSFFPLPRSTNLYITGKCEKYDMSEYLEVVELNMELLSLDPLDMRISITGVSLLSQSSRQ
jgi:predicted Zn-dependent protease